MSRPVAVVGAGAWGTTLAMVLAQNGHEVRLWEYFPEYAKHLQSTRENTKFLPSVTIPESITITSDLQAAVEGCQDLVLVSPSQSLRSVIRRLVEIGSRPQVVVTASKDRQEASGDLAEGETPPLGGGSRSAADRDRPQGTSARPQGRGPLIRVVVDTIVLVSSLLGTGPSRQALNRVRDGQDILCVSPAILT